jgi:hypothetical protein
MPLYLPLRRSTAVVQLPVRQALTTTAYNTNESALQGRPSAALSRHTVTLRTHGLRDEEIASGSKIWRSLNKCRHRFMVEKFQFSKGQPQSLSLHWLQRPWTALRSPVRGTKQRRSKNIATSRSGSNWTLVTTEKLRKTCYKAVGTYTIVINGNGVPVQFDICRPGKQRPGDTKRYFPIRNEGICNWRRYIPPGVEGCVPRQPCRRCR